MSRLVCDDPGTTTDQPGGTLLGEPRIFWFASASWTQSWTGPILDDLIAQIAARPIEQLLIECRPGESTSLSLCWIDWISANREIPDIVIKTRLHDQDLTGPLRESMNLGPLMMSLDDL